MLVIIAQIKGCVAGELPDSEAAVNFLQTVQTGALRPRLASFVECRLSAHTGGVYQSYAWITIIGIIVRGALEYGVLPPFKLKAVVEKRPTKTDTKNG
jgi:hypothetical protein